MISASPTFSLIIATLGRSEELLRFLESANKETMQCFEVIIVDQNDDDRVETVLKNFSGKFPISYRRESIKNASNARNIGAALAKGNWLGFPDDDCCYAGDTIFNIKTLTETSRAELITGAILDFNHQYFAKSLRLSAEVTLANIRGKITEPAMFIKKDVFFKLKGFDTEFGPGSRNFAGEGLDLGLRVLKEGHKISYHTTIKVLHDKSIPPYNQRAMTVGYRYSYSNGLALEKHYKNFAWYFLAKQAILLPFRSWVKNYPTDKKAYYNCCLEGLIDGIIYKKCRK